ncbi:MAG: CRTAC1 family protein, partial [Candidatus Aminicenantes bacterium]|nr:CRTAC1 family protein [Candidatus Aminicenantes bacterium]
AVVAVLGFCLLSRFLFAAGLPVFREAARETGLNVHHFIGATGEYFFPEIMGSGVGMFDYEGDGDLDLYFVQGAMLDRSKEVSQSSFPFSGEAPPRNRLFRNDLNPTGKLRFTDVTREAGVGHPGYGMGLAVGDYDSDGDPDLYLTNFGSNVLYRNNGDGTFTDVTRDAGVDDPRYSASSTFVDYDSDGDLDLYVANYVSFTIQGNRRCGSERRDYCAPDVYQPLPDRLFRNDGNGRFTDRSEEAGLGRAFGAGLGVVAVDLDLDRRVDIYVANDGTPNQLWINQGDGTFQDQGLVSGTAYNIDGMAEAGMGVTAADFDGDGDDDLFVTHNKKETNTLYLNGRRTGFADATSRFGLAIPSVPYSGFGTLWFDYDNDGWLDLFVANGAVVMDDRQPADSAYPYAQENQLFRGDGTGRFREIGSDVAGAALELAEVSRGAAFGDIDNDGDVDIAISNNNGPARLLLNQVGSRNHWLGVRLEGDGAAPSAIYQARVALFREGRQPLWRRCHTDGSYLSANDSRILFGLGSSKDVDRVEVHWPDGLCESWIGVGEDRYVKLRKGSGRDCE